MKKRIYSSLLFLGCLVFASEIHAGTIHGEVVYGGDQVFQDKVVKMNSDPTCAMHHSEPVYQGEVLIEKVGGGLKNVFAYVKSGLGDAKFPTPNEPKVLDQRGCLYKPLVFGIQVGQVLNILNSDATLHNVHSMSKENKAFNIGMPIQGMNVTKTFKEEELMFKVKCDVHPWMRTYIGVLNHPYYGVSDRSGNFVIENLPVGSYEIGFWHEKFGEGVQKVEIKEEGQYVKVKHTYE